MKTRTRIFNELIDATKANLCFVVLRLYMDISISSSIRLKHETYNLTLLDTVRPVLQSEITSCHLNDARQIDRRWSSYTLLTRRDSGIHTSS